MTTALSPQPPLPPQSFFCRSFGSTGLTARNSPIQKTHTYALSSAPEQKRSSDPQTRTCTCASSALPQHEHQFYYQPQLQSQSLSPGYSGTNASITAASTANATTTGPTAPTAAAAVLTTTTATINNNNNASGTTSAPPPLATTAAPPPTVPATTSRWCHRVLRPLVSCLRRAEREFGEAARARRMAARGSGGSGRNATWARSSGSRSGSGDAQGQSQAQEEQMLAPHKTRSRSFCLRVRDRDRGSGTAIGTTGMQPVAPDDNDDPTWVPGGRSTGIGTSTGSGNGRGGSNGRVRYRYGSGRGGGRYGGLGDIGRIGLGLGLGGSGSGSGSGKGDGGSMSMGMGMSKSMSAGRKRRRRSVVAAGRERRRLLPGEVEVDVDAEMEMELDVDFDLRMDVDVDEAREHRRKRMRLDRYGFLNSLGGGGDGMLASTTTTTIATTTTTTTTPDAVGADMSVDEDVLDNWSFWAYRPRRGRETAADAAAFADGGPTSIYGSGPAAVVGYGIVGAWETFLVATAATPDLPSGAAGTQPSTKQTGVKQIGTRRRTGAPSLLSSSLGATSAFILAEQRAADADSGTDASARPDIADETFCFLEETYGASGSAAAGGGGWRPLRELVRRHGVRLVCDGLARGWFGVGGSATASSWDVRGRTADAAGGAASSRGDNNTTVDIGRRLVKVATAAGADDAAQAVLATLSAGVGGNGGGSGNSSERRPPRPVRRPRRSDDDGLWAEEKVVGLLRRYGARTGMARALGVEAVAVAGAGGRGKGSADEVAAEFALRQLGGMMARGAVPAAWAATETMRAVVTGALRTVCGQNGDKDGYEDEGADDDAVDAAAEFLLSVIGAAMSTERPGRQVEDDDEMEAALDNCIVSVLAAVSGTHLAGTMAHRSGRRSSEETMRSGFQDQRQCRLRQLIRQLSIDAAVSIERADNDNDAPSRPDSRRATLMLMTAYLLGEDDVLAPLRAIVGLSGGAPTMAGLEASLAALVVATARRVAAAGRVGDSDGFGYGGLAALRWLSRRLLEGADGEGQDDGGGVRKVLATAAVDAALRAAEESEEAAAGPAYHAWAAEVQDAAAEAEAAVEDTEGSENGNEDADHAFSGRDSDSDSGRDSGYRSGAGSSSSFSSNSNSSSRPAFRWDDSIGEWVASSSCGLDHSAATATAVAVVICSRRAETAALADAAAGESAAAAAGGDESDDELAGV